MWIAGRGYGFGDMQAKTFAWHYQNIIDGTLE
jgi:hypothetical protein